MSPNRTLESDGFVPAGRITLHHSTFEVDFSLLPDAKWWAPALYAFRISDEVVRIGKTETVLKDRIADWNRDVSDALAGELHKGGTPLWESEQWRKRLTDQVGEFLARRGPTDTKLLKDLEKELIEAYDPPLCHDSPSARLRRRGAT